MGSGHATSKILPCCVETMRIHAANNPMMVCNICKQLIKCFTDESAYQRYIRFCQSRGRKVLEGVYNQYRVVIFRSYD
jgi:hypothetical protein